MGTDRRKFLRLAATGTGALGLGLSGSRAPFGVAPAHAQPERPVPPAPRTLDLLILGGTGFTGPHQIRYAVERGHRVTVFNRGRSQADLPDGVVRLAGDRNEGQLDELRDRTWDAVIDNPTTLPHWVRDAAEILHDRTGQYVFISTISVYDPAGQTAIDEDSPLREYRDGDPLDVGMAQYQQNAGGLYGAMKTASEREARKWFGDRATIIRPGLIVGPRDQTDRFTYWPLRIARGGEILAPGDGTDPVQIVDARDLAEWTIRMVENRVTGTFNATGPRSPLSMAAQLHGIRAALPGDLDVAFRWVSADFLAEHGVRPWAEMTTWFGVDDVLSRTSIARAVASGLTFRPLAQTAADTLEWFRTLPAERQAQLRAGLDPEKERTVLSAWRARARA